MTNLLLVIVILTFTWFILFNIDYKNNLKVVAAAYIFGIVRNKELPSREQLQRHLETGSIYAPLPMQHLLQQSPKRWVPAPDYMSDVSCNRIREAVHRGNCNSQWVHKNTCLYHLFFISIFIMKVWNLHVSPFRNIGITSIREVFGVLVFEADSFVEGSDMVRNWTPP